MTDAFVLVYFVLISTTVFNENRRLLYYPLLSFQRTIVTAHYHRNQLTITMLRAPVLMRSMRKNNQKLPVPKQHRDKRRDDELAGPPTFSSICSVDTELSVVITIRNQKYENFEGVFYKDDEDRFRQR